MGSTASKQPKFPYSIATTLIPMWAVLSVHTFSASTVQLYLYFPYGPYSLYTALVPVQYIYTSTPPWTVLPVNTLSACTVQLYLYSPMGSIACKNPHCLYSTAIPLLPL